MAQHVAMQHPGSRIVQDDENFPRLADLQIGRVPVWTGFTRRIEFPEMVAMQMHDVWEPGFVGTHPANNLGQGLKPQEQRCVTPHMYTSYAYNHYGPTQNTTGKNFYELMSCVYE